MTVRKRKRMQRILPSLYDLPSKILVDIFSRVVKAGGVEDFFKLIKINRRCRDISKSPLLLQNIRVEWTPPSWRLKPASGELCHCPTEKREPWCSLLGRGGTRVRTRNWLSRWREDDHLCQSAPRAIYTEYTLNMSKEEIRLRGVGELDALKQ